MSTGMGTVLLSDGEAYRGVAAFGILHSVGVRRGYAG